jgi:hypothetical protein
MPFRIRQPAATTKGRKPCGGRTAILHRNENLHDRRHVAMACWAAFGVNDVLCAGTNDLLFGPPKTDILSMQHVHRLANAVPHFGSDPVGPV